MLYATAQWLAVRRSRRQVAHLCRAILTAPPSSATNQRRRTTSRAETAIGRDMSATVPDQARMTTSTDACNTFNCPPPSSHVGQQPHVYTFFPSCPSPSFVLPTLTMVLCIIFGGRGCSPFSGVRRGAKDVEIHKPGVGFRVYHCQQGSSPQLED